MNLTDGLEFWSRWTPHTEALVSGGVRYSWLDLARRCDRMAAGLSAAGVCKGDRVAIYAGTDVRWYDTVMAALRLGAVVVPLNLRIEPHVVAAVLEDAQCGLVVTDTERLTDLRRIPKYDSRYRLAVFSPEHDRFSSPVGDLYAHVSRVTKECVAPDHPAVIAYTSGTTGAPKGAVLTHGGILAFSGALSRALGWSTSTRFLHMGPLSYTAGIIQGILAQSIGGGALILEDQFEVGRLVELLMSERITAWHGLSVQWQALRALEGFGAMSFPLLTSAITGGAALPDDLFDAVSRQGIVLRHVYGMTEAGGTIAMATPESMAYTPRSVGLPLMHTSVRIADCAGHDVAPGTLGEIMVRSPAVMREYWRKPGATRRTLVDGWLRTGDLGSIDGRGLLHVVDRRANAIQSTGGDVFPALIERAALGVSGVAEAVAIGFPDHPAGQVPVLIVRLSRHRSVGAILADLRSNLPVGHLPHEVLVGSRAVTAKPDWQSAARRGLRPVPGRLPRLRLRALSRRQARPVAGEDLRPGGYRPDRSSPASRRRQR
jgi:fatty-acyl-CoA synthase